jgi:ATP-dependent DNA helicase RecG
MTDLAHLDGPLPDLLDQSLAWVARNLRTAVRYDADGHAYDQPEIPLAAVRELVANALIHRDLSPRTQSKRVEIRLLPDKLVIASPGGLWGVTREQLGEPRGKSAVNEFLYDIARLVRTPNGRRIIEGEGGGIREAQAALLQAGLPEPWFIDTGVSFTAIIHRALPAAGRSTDQPLTRPAGLPASPNLTAVSQALVGQPQSISAIMKATGLSRRQVKLQLDKLVDQGLVQVHGGAGNRFTTYQRT